MTRTFSDMNYTKFTDAIGSYSFYVRVGNYTITPTNPLPPQSSNCFHFTPLKRELIVPTDFTSNITDQYFIATQITPCYSIGGRVTASNNPTYGVRDIKITLSDQENNEIIRYTDVSGYYHFRYFGSGAYTITPGSGSLFIPSFREVTITGSDIYSQDFIKVF